MKKLAQLRSSVAWGGGGGAPERAGGASENWRKRAPAVLVPVIACLQVRGSIH